MSCTPLPKAAKPVWAKQLTRLPCLVVYVKFQFVFSRPFVKTADEWPSPFFLLRLIAAPLYKFPRRNVWAELAVAFQMVMGLPVLFLVQLITPDTLVRHVVGFARNKNCSSIVT